MSTRHSRALRAFLTTAAAPILASTLSSVSLAFAACATNEAAPPASDERDASVVPTLDASSNEDACGSTCPDSGNPIEWQSVEAPDLGSTTVASIRGIESRLWISGTQGFVAYRENDAWRRVNVPSFETVVALWGTSTTDLLAAGGGNTLYRFQESHGGWGTEKLVPEGWYPFPEYRPTASMAGVTLTGTSADDLWAVLVSRGDPGDPTMPPPTGSHLWHKKVDAGFVLEFGCATQPMPGAARCPIYRAAWTGLDAVPWFVGERGRLARGEAGKVSPQGPTEIETHTNADLSSIWGSSPRDVWIVGTGGTLLRWSGEKLTEWESPTRSDLHSVWGRSADDVWAVGASGTVLHFDGAGWTVSETGRKEPLHAVGGTNEDVWAGGKGILLRRIRHPEDRQP